MPVEKQTVAMTSREKKLELVKSHVKNYPDFPKPGIIFRDIFGVFAHTEAMAGLFDIIRQDAEGFRGKIEAVGGLDSRGFLFGPQVALQLKVPFIPVRKNGKLPGKTIGTDVKMEYNSVSLEVQDNKFSGNILLVDDLLATGGSLKAATQLLSQVGFNVSGCYVILELLDLKGRDNIPCPVHSLITY